MKDLKNIRNPIKKRKIKKLLDLQKSFYMLSSMVNEIEDMERKRDVLFLDILKEMSKITNIDYIKLLEKDIETHYKNVGTLWKAKDSLLWLERILNKIFKDF